MRECTPMADCEHMGRHRPHNILRHCHCTRGAQRGFCNDTPAGSVDDAVTHFETDAFRCEDAAGRCQHTEQ